MLLAARAPAVVLMPLLLPRLPLPCMELGCDDGCFLPDEPEPNASVQPETTLDGMAFMPDELSVLSLPTAPDPSLSHTDVVEAICRGLQFPNVPITQSGVMRLHDFATFECRATLTGCRGCSEGPEVFAREAELWALPGCEFFSLSGGGSLIPATQTRGAMATVMVEVVEAKGFRFRSGFERTYPKKPKALPKAAKPKQRPVILPPPPKGFVWAESLNKRAPEPVMSEGAEDGTEDVHANAAEMQIERYQFTMYQERRPPLTGCWLVKGIIPVTQHQLFGADGDF